MVIISPSTNSALPIWSQLERKQPFVDPRSPFRRGAPCGSVSNLGRKLGHHQGEQPGHIPNPGGHDPFYCGQLAPLAICAGGQGTGSPPTRLFQAWAGHRAVIQYPVYMSILGPQVHGCIQGRNLRLYPAVMDFATGSSVLARRTVGGLENHRSRHFLGWNLSGLRVTINGTGAVLLGRGSDGDCNRISLGCHHHLCEAVHLEHPDHSFPDAICSAFFLHSPAGHRFTAFRVGITRLPHEACDGSPLLPICHCGLRQLFGLVLATPPVPGWSPSRVHFPDPLLWRHSQRNIPSRATDGLPRDWTRHGYRWDLPCKQNSSLVSQPRALQCVSILVGFRTPATWREFKIGRKTTLQFPGLGRYRTALRSGSLHNDFPGQACFVIDSETDCILLS